MTSATVSVPHLLSFATIKRLVMTDPGVSKVFLICVTAIVGEVVAGFAYIATVGGDVGAVSIAIGGFLSALVAGGVKMLNAKKNGGVGDGGTD